MKILSREECEKALEVLDCKAHYGCDKGYSQDEELCKICENKDFIEMDVLEQLIKERFDDNGNVRAIANIVIDKDEIKETVKEMVDDSVNKILNPQPYKFEDLKKEMWVWDDKLKRCVNCDPAKNSMGIDCIWYWYDYDFEGELSEDYIEFEENRFFPITKALEYQGKEDASK